MPAPKFKLTTNRKIACGRALRGLEFGTLTPFEVPLAPDAAKPRPPVSQPQELARKFLLAVCYIAGMSAAAPLRSHWFSARQFHFDRKRCFLRGWSQASR
jgi:hypothetical protein